MWRLILSLMVAAMVCPNGLRGNSAVAPLISEFLAINQGGLKDEDGATPDWIELHNPGPTAVDLKDWALTDVATNLVQWRFPATNLPAGGYLIVFASGKDRKNSGAPLHTNFRLNEGGEFLALVTPDGTNVISAFAPTYRTQFPNVSYGRTAGVQVTLLPVDGAVKARVPEGDSLGSDWQRVEFDDSDWQGGSGGVGYESSPADYVGLLGLDVGPAMQGHNPTVYVRYSFKVGSLVGLSRLRLLAQYDDGFVAWLNGREVARRNAPEVLTWNASASADHPDGLAVVPEEIDLSAFISDLRQGDNLLAVQGLNIGLLSSDLLMRFGLQADQLVQNEGEAYFNVPTPGAENRGGTAVLGPLIQDLQRNPLEPRATDEVTVTARVTKTIGTVDSVNLIYRVRFEGEKITPMFDDGQHGDGTAGDDIYGAKIPVDLVPTGDMIRYRIEATDQAHQAARLPLYIDPRDSEQYLGFVVRDPTIESALPVVHLFVQNIAGSEGFGGTRASLAFLGEFYDNLEIRLHGQSSSGFPKKSFNLDFPRDHRFRYATNQPRVKDLKLLTNYGDKSRLHNTLAYETIAAAGGVGHFAFSVRVQRNAAFHGILDMVEDGDERWLERVKRNPEGALYKVYDALENSSGSEKKTRKDESRADLQALIDGLAPSKPLAARVAYAYDNLDLPQTISYFVGLALVSSQDHGHKNFYAYRDTPGSGDWTLFPWDVDLTFGRNWTDSAGYFTDTIYTNNVLSFYNSSQQGKPANRLYTLIFTHPEFRAMYLRRLRTVMETILQEPGTPASQLQLETRIRELLDRLDPINVAKSDADLDEAKWGSWGTRRSTRAEAQRIVDLYLPGRRNFLFSSPAAILNHETIPDSQPTNPAVRVDGLEFNPVSGRQTEEFVRLTNAETVAVDISGWRLQGQIRHTFRPGTVIPANRSLYVSPNVAAFRGRATSPKRGENIEVQGNYDGQLSARGGRVELANETGQLVNTFFYFGAPTPLQQNLRLSELMYHPSPPPNGSPFSAEDFEFVELKNAGNGPLSLLGAQFNEGITYTFTNVVTATLAPGARILLVKNAEAFRARYGEGFPVVGSYIGSLANEGESLRLQDSVGETVFEFRYDQNWSAAADGGGYSLEPIGAEADLDLPASWRPSPQWGGNPGKTHWPASVVGWVLDDTGRVTIRVRVEAGSEYRLEASRGLSPAAWMPITPAQSGAEQQELEFSVPTPSGEKPTFFRVRAE